MRRETVLIVLLIASVLVPMWYVAMTSGTEGDGVGLGKGEDPVSVNQSAPIDPTGKFLPTPVEVGPNQSGVITWAALLLTVAVMVGATRFRDRLGHLQASVTHDEVDADAAADGGEVSDASDTSSDHRSDGGPVSEANGSSSEQRSDGGSPVIRVPPYLQTADRWIVDYVPAPADRTGLIALAGLSWCSVIFAALLALEGLGQARNQFIGTYAGMLCLSLAATILVYAVFFVPSITVAERRGH